MNRFIEELFSKLEVPVQVSPGIKGFVNGDFEKSARDVFQDICSSFQLTMYYDGVVAFVYPANDVKRSILPVSSTVAERVVANVELLGFEDALNTVQAGSGGGLMVTGSQRFVEQVDELVTAVQGSAVRSNTSSPVTYRVFRLKYAWADDVSLAVGGQELVVPGVASVLRTLIEPGTLNAPASTSRRSQGRTVPGLRGKGLQSVADKGTGDSSNRQNAPPAGDSAAVRFEPVQTKGVQSTTQSRIVADTRLNAVVIRDSADRMPMYESLIASLDVKPRMLEIEATIIDLNTDRLRELGVNWRLQGDNDEALFGNGTLSDQLLQPNANITPRGEGGVVSLVMGGPTKFIARIRALESQGAARIVSKPHVITLSDVEAILDTTSTFFVRVAGDEEVDLFNVSVGTTLRVTPHVFDSDDGPQIKLLVKIEDGSTSDRQVDSIPVIDRSTVNTQALIKAGQSLLIGGLVRESKNNTVRKVPVLGNIPVLGSLFRSNGTSSNRVERMFLITPRLVGETSTAHTMNAPILSGAEGAILESVPLRSRDVDGALVRRDQIKPLPEPLSPMRSSVSLIPDEVAAAVEADRKRQAARPEPTRMPTLRDRLLRNLDGQPAPGSGQQPDVIQDLMAGKKQPVPEADDEGWIEIPSTSAAEVEGRPFKTRAPTDDEEDDFQEWQEVN